MCRALCYSDNMACSPGIQSHAPCLRLGNDRRRQGRLLLSQRLCQYWPEGLGHSHEAQISWVRAVHGGLAVVSEQLLARDVYKPVYARLDQSFIGGAEFLVLGQVGLLGPWKRRRGLVLDVLDQEDGDIRVCGAAVQCVPLSSAAACSGNSL